MFIVEEMSVASNKYTSIPTLLQVPIIPNSRLAALTYDHKIIPDLSETNQRNWSITMHGTLQCGSMGIPDPNSRIR